MINTKREMITKSLPATHVLTYMFVQENTKYRHSSGTWNVPGHKNHVITTFCNKLATRYDKNFNRPVYSFSLLFVLRALTIVKNHY